ncbi:hypothetical protein [Flagellimonas marina]|uniref:DUF443 family protein n=1 Tax=Flagellimonas marina TaxID=1775168 RepID=A0ABV8PI44_9FLAO
MEISRSDIVKLIEEKKTDSFETHLWTIIKRDSRPSGEIGNREIKVWKMNFWNGLFYPIFHFDLNKDDHLIKISDRINPAGRLFLSLFCILTCIPWFYWVFDDFDLSQNWPKILFGFIFLGTLVIIGFRIYKMEKEIQLEEIYDLLDMEIENSSTEKEWGWKKILLRSITYPLSFFLIAVSIFFVLKQGNYFTAIATLTIVGFYLYSDLKIIFKKKKSK